MSKSQKKLSERYADTAEQGAKGGTGKFKLSKPIVIASTAVVVCAVGVVAVATLGDKGTKSDDVSAYNVVVTGGKTNTSKQGDSEEIPSSYDVSMNSTWKFENARVPSENAYVANIASNKNTVYFEVMMSDTGKVIYTSPDIPVGGHLENIKLEDTSLKAGTYPCVVTYNLLGKDRQKLTEVSVNVALEIGND